MDTKSSTSLTINILNSNHSQSVFIISSTKATIGHSCWFTQTLFNDSELLFVIMLYQLFRKWVLTNIQTILSTYPDLSILVSMRTSFKMQLEIGKRNQKFQAILLYPSKSQVKMQLEALLKAYMKLPRNMYERTYNSSSKYKRHW